MLAKKQEWMSQKRKPLKTRYLPLAKKLIKKNQKNGGGACT